MIMRTIPGTFDDWSRCDYEELCIEAREGIDAIVVAHTDGAMKDNDALMLLRFLGLCDAAAKDILDINAKVPWDYSIDSTPGEP